MSSSRTLVSSTSNSRIFAFQSMITSCRANARNPIQRDEKRVPDAALFRQGFAARRRETVIAPAAQSPLFDPPSFNESFVLEPVERRIQRSDMKVDGSIRPLFDQLADLISMSLPFFEQC